MTTQPVAHTSKPPAILKNLKKGMGDFLKNEKVKQVVTGIFSILMGIAVGALIGSIIGANPIIIGAIVGGMAGGIVYAAVAGVIHVIKMKGYPAHAHAKSVKHNNRKPLSTFKDWGSDDNLQVFKNVVIEHFSEKEWFKNWKGSKGFTRDNQAAEHLFGKWIQKGLSIGESQELLRLSKKHPDLKGESFLRKVTAENLFKRQIPEFVRKDLEKEGGNAGLISDVEAELDKIPDLEAAGSIHYNLKNFGSFKTDLKPRLNSLSGATFQFDGSKRPSLFIRLNKPYSFYDPFSKKFGGLHEDFKSEDDFINKLYQNLKCYHSKWRLSKPQETGIIKFYR